VYDTGALVDLACWQALTFMHACLVDGHNMSTSIWGNIRRASNMILNSEIGMQER
jgi:hypothetical protein